MDDKIEIVEDVEITYPTVQAEENFIYMVKCIANTVLMPIILWLSIALASCMFID